MNTDSSELDYILHDVRRICTEAEAKQAILFRYRSVEDIKEAYIKRTKHSDEVEKNYNFGYNHAIDDMLAALKIDNKGDNDARKTKHS